MGCAQGRRETLHVTFGGFEPLTVHQKAAQLANRVLRKPIGVSNYGTCGVTAGREWQATGLAVGKTILKPATTQGLQA